MIKKSQYHIALNGKGYLLAGSSTRPARSMKQSPKYGETPTEAEVQYIDTTQFFPWVQTDWSGGFQKEKWEDTASFKLGNNIDVLKKFGEITLQKTVKAVKDNFLTGHTFSSHCIANNYLMVGTQHETLAQLWYFNNADDHYQITTGWSAITKVKDMAVYKEKVLLALERSSGSESTLQYYDFTSISTIRNTSDVCRAVEVIGERIWLAELNSTTNGDRLIYSDDGGTNWTEVITKTGQNRQIIKMEANYGVLYFLIQDGTKIELWQVVDTDITKVYSFEYLSTVDLKTHNSNIYVSGLDEDGKVMVYEWTGGQLNLLFQEKVDSLTASSLKLVSHKGDLVLHGLVYDGQVWTTHIAASISGGSVLIPFASFGTTTTGLLYFYGTGSEGALDIYKVDTIYAASGYYTSGAYYGNKYAIDKLYQSCVINCKALAAGEQIKVEYSLDNETTWVELGTLNHTNDGAISKKDLVFPSGTTSRAIHLKITLTAGTAQITTPTLLDIALRYKPMPEERYTWQITVKCLDDMYLLDQHSKETELGIELRNQLLTAKEIKSVVNFEDIDFFETALSADIDADDTTILLKNTVNMPEKGRFKIGDEWITYTSLSDAGVEGAVRGARGTTATAHFTDDTVSNLYKVFVKNYQEELRIANEPKTEELYVSLTLDEI